MKIKPLKEQVRAFERAVIAKALLNSKSKTAAAAALGITTATIRQKMLKP